MNVHPLLAAVLGAAVVGIVWFVATDGGEPSPSDDTFDDGSIEYAGDGLDAVFARFDRLDERLDRLEASFPSRRAVDRTLPIEDGPMLEGRPTIADGASESGPNATPAPIITDEVLERTLARIEEKKYADYADKELMAEARRLRKDRDHRGAKRMLERMLARKLDDETRTNGLTMLGMEERSLGDFESSAKALRSAVDLSGEHSVRGANANYQLVWTLSSAGKKDEAQHLAARVVDSRGLTEHTKPGARWAHASLTQDTGDTSRARALLEQLVSDYANDKRHEWVVKDARRRLKEMGR